MPRRKAADRAGAVKTRSHGGCKECRKSHVRCDMTKPLCTRCQKKGLPCTSQMVLKWEADFASRGIAFGRAGVWSKTRGTQSKKQTAGGSPLLPLPAGEQEWCLFPAIETWGFVHSGVSTFEQPDKVDVAHDEFDSLIVRDGPGMRISSPMASLSLFPHISEPENWQLFEYYFDQVCPRTTASSKQHSPFASVILPFCMSASPSVFKAIQALSACHRARFASGHGALGLRLKHEALRDLRCSLASKGSLACSSDPEVLVIMMMLCLYEIVDNCDQHWTIHLKGAKELIRLKKQQGLALSGTGNNGTQDPVSIFTEHFFAFQDVMGRTACGEEVLFGSDYWSENDRRIDPWMGCSPELVSILSSITELSRSRRQCQSDSARLSFLARAACLEHNLEHLVQETNDNNDGDDDHALQSVADLKRLAAVLYLHCALYSASPSTPLVVGYVRQILHLVSDVLDTGCIVGMTWPVFVAAVELDPFHDELWIDSDHGSPVYGRPLILRALAAMAQSSVSNVARTKAVIAKVWQARDHSMIECTSTDVSALSDWNDWEQYVAPISTAMSLA